MSSAPKIALLARLLETGEAHEGQKIKNLISRYSTARWITPGKRRATWALREEERATVQTRLELLLPSWQQDFVLLRSVEDLNRFVDQHLPIYDGITPESQLLRLLLADQKINPETC